MSEKKKITIRPSEEKVTTVEEVEVKPKKSCYFCESKKDPSYTDLVILKKYLTERAKIVAKLRSGTCSRHQRAVSRQIKYARNLSLLPFVPKV